MIYLVSLHRNGAERTGTLDLGHPRGQWRVTMWMCDPDGHGLPQAILRLARNDTIWETKITYFPPSAYPEPSAGHWHGFMELDEWRWRLSGEMHSGVLELSFDDSCPQRCPGGARIDENGRVLADEGEEDKPRRRKGK